MQQMSARWIHDTTLELKRFRAFHQKDLQKDYQSTSLPHIKLLTSHLVFALHFNQFFNFIDLVLLLNARPLKRSAHSLPDFRPIHFVLEDESQHLYRQFLAWLINSL